MNEYREQRILPIFGGGVGNFRLHFLSHFFFNLRNDHLISDFKLLIYCLQWSIELYKAEYTRHSFYCSLSNLVWMLLGNLQLKILITLVPGGHKRISDHVISHSGPSEDTKRTYWYLVIQSFCFHAVIVVDKATLLAGKQLSKLSSFSLTLALYQLKSFELAKATL